MRHALTSIAGRADIRPAVRVLGACVRGCKRVQAHVPMQRLQRLPVLSLQRERVTSALSCTVSGRRWHVHMAAFIRTLKLLAGTVKVV